MKGSFVSSDDRNSMITMFIVAYVICILCAIIPLIFIFGLPEKAKDVAYFKGGNNSDNNQKELLMQFDTYVTTLDSLLKAENLGSRYDKGTFMLRMLTDSLKKESNPYNSVLTKFADLYDQIKAYCENSKRVNDLAKENATLKTDIVKKDEALKKLEEEKKALEEKLNKPKEGN